MKKSTARHHGSTRVKFIMLGASPGEPSQELRSMGHGLFTQAFLSLKEKGELTGVSNTECIGKISREMSALAARNRLCPAQTPYISYSGSGAFFSGYDGENDKGTRHALCVGINKYQAGSISSLRYSEADARAYAAFLRSYRYNVSLLCGRKATASAIWMHVARMLTVASEGDLVLLFWSGHGVYVDNRLVLPPYDAVPAGHSILNVVGLDEVSVALDQCKAHQAFFVDAGFAQWDGR